MQQHAGKGKPLRHAAAEHPHRIVGPCDEVNPVEKVINAPVGILHPKEIGIYLQVLTRREVEVCQRIVRQVADAAPCPARSTWQLLSQHRERAGAGT